MSLIDPNKKIQKYRTEEEMRYALLIVSQEGILSIPPQIDDIDIVLSDVVEELLEAREKLKERE